MNAVVIEKQKKKGIIDKEFELLSWILRARCQDNMRKVLMGVYVDHDGTFAATDGHRLHFAKIEKYSAFFTPGVWSYVHHSKSVIVLKESDGNYPDYKRVVPHPDSLKGVGDIYDDRSDVPAYRIFKMANRAVNISYLSDIVRGGLVYNVKMIPDKERDPLVFEREDRTAILMPLMLQL